MTLEECMRHIKPYNGEADPRINKIWEIENVEEYFQLELEEHPKWLELTKKHKPQYVVMESNVQLKFTLMSLAIFRNGEEKIPVIALILVH